MKTIIINQNDSGQRVDKFLSKLLPDMPKSLLYKQLRKKRVKRNKKALAAQDVLACGDELCLYINDEFFKEKRQLTAGGAGVSVVYEDEHIIVLDKPAGQAAHGGDDSLLACAQAYLFAKGEYDPQAENSFAPALSNRLDRNTRGLVLVGKTAAAQKMLNEKIRQGEIEKQYRCVVHGTPQPEKGRLTSWLLISTTENRVAVCCKDTPGAKEAILDYEVLRQSRGLSLLSITLHTGRKHQIRVQLAEAGHPLLGDTRYGAPRDGQFAYQALCACRLIFRFQTEAGVLEHLRGRTLALTEEPFEDLF